MCIWHNPRALFSQVSDMPANTNIYFLMSECRFVWHRGIHKLINSQVCGRIAALVERIQQIWAIRSFTFLFLNWIIAWPGCWTPHHSSSHGTRMSYKRSMNKSCSCRTKPTAVWNSLCKQHSVHVMYYNLYDNAQLQKIRSEVAFHLQICPANNLLVICCSCLYRQAG